MTSTLTIKSLRKEFGKKSMKESFLCALHLWKRNKPDDILKDVYKYIEEKDYTMPVAHLMVGVAANALNINLKIYENDKGVKKEIDFEPDNAHSVISHSALAVFT